LSLKTLQVLPPGIKDLTLDEDFHKRAPRRPVSYVVLSITCNYWDHAIAWLDEETVIIGGIGNNDTEMIDGARILDVTSTDCAGRRRRSDWLCAREVTAFAGPAGKFFTAGKLLYSAAEDGLSRWDLQTGARTGHIANFHPTHHHLGVGELLQLADDWLPPCGSTVTKTA
jgi:hypothetical protein